MDTKQTSTDELFKTLVAELVTRAVRAQVEPLVEARVSAAIEDTETRAYSDAEVCARLGGISRTSLWRLRKRHPRLKPRALFPGGPHRTTPGQLRDYLASIEADDGEVINLDEHRRTRKMSNRRKTA